jgi:hypothetical protein
MFWIFWIQSRVGKEIKAIPLSAAAAKTYCAIAAAKKE